MIGAEVGHGAAFVRVLQQCAENVVMGGFGRGADDQLKAEVGRRGCAARRGFAGSSAFGTKNRS
jgi:hypothetical protein